MMPGGEIEPNESPSDAAVRELQEETGLTASSAVHLMDWESTTNRHNVFRIEAEGEVRVGIDEIDSFLWWDRQTKLPVFPHVNVVLDRLSEDLRARATAVVIRDGRVLLVEDPSVEGYHMPGGGIEAGETPEEAVARELLEETGLNADHIEFLFNWKSIVNLHSVFRVETDGDVAVDNEIGSFLWWDRQTELPLFPHVNPILDKLDGHE